MSVNEVARSLGVSRGLIYKHIKAGYLPALMIGRIYRVNVRDFAIYRDANPHYRPEVAE